MADAQIARKPTARMTPMTRLTLLRAALAVAAPLFAAPAFGQSFTGGPIAGRGVVFSSPAWVGENTILAPRAETTPGYNLDAGFLWNAPSATALAPAGRTPLAAAPAAADPRNEP